MGAGNEAAVIVPGTRWTDTQGTDHRLATALAEFVTVLWLDPVVPAVGRAVPGGRVRLPRGYDGDEVAHRVFRIRVAGPPGFTRPGLRQVSSALAAHALRRALGCLAVRPVATIVMSGRDGFPHGVEAPRLLHVTDDWPSGAALMGLGRGAVARTLRGNVARADIVTAVSPGLASVLEGYGAPVVHLVPNGCPPPREPEAVRPRRRVAGLLGQLNERLDMDLLDALGASVDLEVVGPLTARETRTVSRLKRFLGGERVSWLGPLEPSVASARIEGWAVGLTPYRDDAFNRSSFPLKTLEYLAAGLPVVSTELPASRWLDCEWVRVADTRRGFLELVDRELGSSGCDTDVRARKRIAMAHTWRARALDLLALAGVTP